MCKLTVTREAVLIVEHGASKTVFTYSNETDPTLSFLVTNRDGENTVQLLVPTYSLSQPSKQIWLPFSTLCVDHDGSFMDFSSGVIVDYNGSIVSGVFDPDVWYQSSFVVQEGDDTLHPAPNGDDERPTEEDFSLVLHGLGSNDPKRVLGELETAVREKWYEPTEETIVVTSAGRFQHHGVPLMFERWGSPITVVPICDCGVQTHSYNVDWAHAGELYPSRELGPVIFESEDGEPASQDYLYLYSNFTSIKDCQCPDPRFNSVQLRSFLPIDFSLDEMADLTAALEGSTISYVGDFDKVVECYVPDPYDRILLLGELATVVSVLADSKMLREL